MLLVFVGAIASALTACENNFEKVKVIARDNLAQAQTAHNVEIFYSTAGKVQARVLAPVVEHRESTSPVTLMPAGVTAYFLDSLGNLKSTLRANHAKRFEKERVMEGTGNVVVTNVDGDTLRTERLVWEETKDRLYSDKAVRITTKTEVLVGDGLESNQTFTRYRILKPRGIFSVKK